jgi:hypothetical protein
MFLLTAVTLSLTQAAIGANFGLTSHHIDGRATARDLGDDLDLEGGEDRGR